METRIKEVLKEKGMTAKDLANAIGISTQAISQAINGNPTIGTLEKIANAMGVPVVELLCTTTGVIVCPNCKTKIRLDVNQE